MKTRAILMTVFFVLNMLSAGFALDYRQQAVEFLAKELNVPPEKIMVDGGIVDLPMTGEKFWAGKYYIEGKEPLREPVPPSYEPGGKEDPGSVPPDSVEPVPPDMVDSKPTEDNPEPDRLHDTATIMPVEPGMVDGFDPYMGGIYIRVKTGEVMNYLQAEPFFNAEYTLVQQEWEKLSREAGKIAVELYLKIKNASPGQKYNLFIQGVFVETQAMRDAIAKVYEDYPEFHNGQMGEPGVIDESGEVRILPLAVDFGPTQGEGASPGYAGDGSGRDLDTAVTDPAERPAPQDDFDYERYEEMYKRLDEIWQQGYDESLAKIKARLVTMGVDYEEQPYGTVLCSLTGDQILSMKNVDYIESIFDELYFRTMAEGGFVTDDSILSAFPPKAYESNGAPGRDNSLVLPLMVLLGLAGCAAVYMVTRRKKNSTNPA